jgi:hypothetical protein
VTISEESNSFLARRHCTKISFLSRKVFSRKLFIKLGIAFGFGTKKFFFKRCLKDTIHSGFFSFVPRYLGFLTKAHVFQASDTDAGVCFEHNFTTYTQVGTNIYIFEWFQLRALDIQT